MWFKDFMGVTIYQLFYYFIFYSFMGWIMETCYATYKTRRFINRGFLAGPLCPIYGFGAVIVVIILSPLKNDAFLLFTGGAFLASVLEYITGYVLEKAFNIRWWDYSSKPHNLQGRICLRFSVLWGILSVVLLNTLHPGVQSLLGLLSKENGIIAAWVITVCFTVDLAVTIASMLHLNVRLQQLTLLSNEIRGKIENLKTLELSLKVEELQKKIRELTHQQEALLNKKFLLHARLLDAFPHIRSIRFEATLKEVKERLPLLRKKDRKTKR